MRRGLVILLALILIALLVTAIVLLLRRSATKPPDARSSAEQVLAERFARGEIDEEEFIRRRNALRS